MWMRKKGKGSKKEKKERKEKQNKKNLQKLPNKELKLSEVSYKNYSLILNSYSMSAMHLYEDPFISKGWLMVAVSLNVNVVMISEH